MIFDWDHELALSKYQGVLHWVNGTNEPHSMLVNGLGRNKTYLNDNNENIFTPTARFRVKKVWCYYTNVSLIVEFCKFTFIKGFAI